jgi:hypothetical protein
MEQITQKVYSWVVYKWHHRRGLRKGRSGDEPSTILSAVSEDGLRFELEPGQRTDPRFKGVYSWGTPR